ncbi:protein-glutamine gamma-glutamyltransferase [Brevibacillus humidisoli]|uniref:protein-glutamine gamma-glutamyltransferase n=1 Tax=Brevibacillus humidisoli TaxID=2895522 RepID=UPI001E334CEE|nr:protein-glutamine gamma-glutamyltransferase [Brevibacillus humidisoli]UFJ39286.1 protein-glutamine gamma-glutamyltransferase [Brevibacillus humidisoli]
MIQLGGNNVQADSLLKEQQWTEAQVETIEKMAASNEVFSYPDQTALQFELTLRQYIVQAAKALNASGVSFATFKKSRCNEKYWNLTDFGGFRIRDGVFPSDGIQDIYRNGRLYAFECATAMVIVYYRAVLAAIKLPDFNRLFANMLLYDWHYDQDLGLSSRTGTVMLPGDVVYFKNPDYHPDTPQWQGENAIVLSNGQYYGHGIGITDASRMIRVLNSLRKPDAARSAYLTDTVARPGFAYLQQFKRNTLSFDAFANRRTGVDRLAGWIGSRYYEV